MAGMTLSPWQEFAAAANHRPFLPGLPLRFQCKMDVFFDPGKGFLGFSRQLCKQCVRSLQTPWILGVWFVEARSVADSLLCCYAN